MKMKKPIKVRQIFFLQNLNEKRLFWDYVGDRKKSEAKKDKIGKFSNEGQKADQEKWEKILGIHPLSVVVNKRFLHLQTIWSIMIQNL